MDILSKILNHEQSVFDEYCKSRQKLIQHIKNIKGLNRSQMNVFVHDLKAIVEPIKTSINEIDYYFTNTDFKKTESIEALEKVKQLNFLYLFLRLGSSETEETEETEVVSDSDSDSLDVSESESKSSRSVSETFSNKN